MLRGRHLTRSVVGRCLWRDLDLELRPGECLGITGRSGSGKTVLLRTLAGLEPLQDGGIEFCGRAQSQWRMPLYRARVVYLPQRPTLREGTVEATLRAPFAFKVRAGTSYPDHRARQMLDALGRDAGFLSQRTEHLSGGEAQIVALLRALLVAPDILLLDEPTASLDSGTVEDIERLVTGWLAGQDDRACIWTGHDRAQLERVSSRLLTIGTPA